VGVWDTIRERYPQKLSPALEVDVQFDGSDFLLG